MRHLGGRATCTSPSAMTRPSLSGSRRWSSTSLAAMADWSTTTIGSLRSLVSCSHATLVVTRYVLCLVFSPLLYIAKKKKKKKGRGWGGGEGEERSFNIFFFCFRKLAFVPTACPMLPTTDSILVTTLVNSTGRLWISAMDPRNPVSLAPNSSKPASLPTS